METPSFCCRYWDVLLAGWAFDRQQRHSLQNNQQRTVCLCACAVVHPRNADHRTPLSQLRLRSSSLVKDSASCWSPGTCPGVWGLGCRLDWWLPCRKRIDKEQRAGFDFVFLFIAWSFWKGRNRRVFECAAVMFTELSASDYDCVFGSEDDQRRAESVLHFSMFRPGAIRPSLNL
jgi:hypothetical protein